MLLVQIPHLDGNDGFILCEPVFDFITKQIKTYFGIVAKSRDCFSIEPTPFILQRHRHIKMIKIDKRFDSSCQHLIKILMIKSHRFWINFASTFWDQPAPLDRCPKRIEADFFHAAQIFLKMRQYLGGLSWALTLEKFFRIGCIPMVPDGRSFVVIWQTAFCLRTAGSGSPPESFGKVDRHFCPTFSCANSRQPVMPL